MSSGPETEQFSVGIVQQPMLSFPHSRKTEPDHYIAAMVILFTGPGHFADITNNQWGVSTRRSCPPCLALLQRTCSAIYFELLATPACHGFFCLDRRHAQCSCQPHTTGKYTSVAEQPLAHTAQHPGRSNALINT